MLKIAIVIVAISMMGPAVSRAEYQDPVIAAHERQGNGGTKLTLQFAGDAGEPTVTRDFTVAPSTTEKNFKEWVHTVKGELTALQATAKLPALQTGQTVAARPLTAPTPNPCSVWRRKVQLYDALAGKEFGGPLGVAVASLKASIENTFDAACGLE